MFSLTILAVTNTSTMLLPSSLFSISNLNPEIRSRLKVKSQTSIKRLRYVLQHISWILASPKTRKNVSDVSHYLVGPRAVSFARLQPSFSLGDLVLDQSSHLMSRHSGKADVYSYVRLAQCTVA